MFDHTDKNEKHTDSSILNQSIQYVLIILITTKNHTDSNILNHSIQYVRTILITVKKHTDSNMHILKANTY
jgi:hypothetical protein